MAKDRDRPVRDRLEDQPLRDRFEEVTVNIPEGPMGKVGGGNILGAVGYTAVESTKPVWQFVPGIRQPGYKITGHGTKELGDGKERHLISTVAISENVARFAAKYYAAPSNIDYIRSDVSIVNVKEITERGTYSTYRITVDVESGSAD